VPTTAEAGYPDVEGDTWFGVLVPAGTPKEIIALLHGEVVKVLAQSDVKARAAALGFEPVGNTPEEFAVQIKAEAARWAKVIREAGIRAQ